MGCAKGGKCPKGIPEQTLILKWFQEAIPFPSPHAETFSDMEKTNPRKPV